MFIMFFLGKMKRAETMPAMRSTSSAAAARACFAITNTNLRATLDEEDLFSQSLDAGRIKLMKASEMYELFYTLKFSAGI